MRKFIISILALASVACVVPSQPGSTNSPQSEPQADSMIRKIADVPTGSKSYTLHCMSNSVCWVGDFLKQWRTDDGGQRWQLIYSGNPNGGEIRTTDYVDERVAWMLTMRKLYKTEDGGRTWIEQISPLPNYPLGEVSAVGFLKGGKTGWISGGLYRPLTRREQLTGVPRNISDPASNTVLEPAIFHTENGGKAWTRQPLPDGSGRIYRPTFVNERQGIVLGDSGVFYTTNGGKQWNHVEFKKSCTDERYLEAYDAPPIEVFLLDSLNAWLTFEDGRIARSTDGGRSWCDLLAPDAVDFGYHEKYFKEIHFTDSLHGFGLGANLSLYETKDGGKTWTKAANSEFDDMFFLDNKTAHLVSKAGIFQLSF